tara:strand:+ start:1320 stop:1952 length:633 start_codon:yes stop_codon:yes gene_type:complete
MKLLLKILVLISSTILLIYSILFLVAQDVEPSFTQSLSKQNEPIYYDKIEKSYDKAGSFKSVLGFTITTNDTLPSFVGQQIRLENNSKIDEIHFGISNQKYLILKLLKNGKIINEVGSNIKGNLPLMTSINLFASYHEDRPTIIKSSEQKLQVKLCEGSGFFGDFANVEIDLKELKPNFQEAELSALNEGVHAPYQLSTVSLWKNYESFD